MSTSDWIDFLRSQGATLDEENGDLLFDSPAAPAARLMPLADQGVLSLQGPDAHTFLQGQLTCDMRLLNPQNSILAGNCSPKGNVISVFRLMMLEPEHLLLRIHRPLSEATQANLNKYMVFSKAQLSDLREDWVGLGLSGPEAERLLQEEFGQAPAEPGQQKIHGQQVLVRVPGQEPRFELWLPLDEAQSRWQSLAAKATPCSSSEWRRQEIAAGLVLMDTTSTETYLPQMLNLQEVGAVSFDKGCYIGQEVVTRLQFRGKLKKCLYRARVDSGECPAPGSSINTPNRNGVGKVLAAAPSATGFELQAVIGKSSADEGGLQLEDGRAVELLELPYAINPELFQR